VRILGGVRTPVAIKQIALDKRAAEAAASGENRGLAALAGRAHPCIVKYLACFQADEGGGRMRMSFVFERCPLAAPFLLAADRNARGALVPGGDAAQGEREGADLMNNPVARAPLALVEAVFVVKQLLSAIAYLHAANIVHRDIKPENTLIWGAARGAGGERLLHVKITDYGTRRTAMEGEGLTVGSGTRNFMAPEVDAATGLAAGRLELVNGTTAWRGGSLTIGAPGDAASGAVLFSNTTATVIAAIDKAVARPALRSKLLEMGAEPIEGITGERFKAFASSEMARYAKLVKDAGIKLE
jgi:hypothetical protein